MTNAQAVGFFFTLIRISNHFSSRSQLT